MRSAEQIFPVFDLTDDELCGDALTRDAEDLLEQAARAVNAAPDGETTRGYAQKCQPRPQICPESDFLQRGGRVEPPKARNGQIEALLSDSFVQPGTKAHV